jgi:hypothetical protein
VTGLGTPFIAGEAAGGAACAGAGSDGVADPPGTNSAAPALKAKGTAFGLSFILLDDSTRTRQQLPPVAGGRLLAAASAQNLKSQSPPRASSSQYTLAIKTLQTVSRAAGLRTACRGSHSPPWCSPGVRSTTSTRDTDFGHIEWAKDWHMPDNKPLCDPSQSRVRFVPPVALRRRAVTSQASKQGTRYLPLGALPARHCAAHATAISCETVMLLHLASANGPIRLSTKERQPIVTAAP